ncbi:MAG: transglycosylase SLT domain-containing protein [Anaerolineales bacterium]|jgi:hypothetical protein
MYLGPKLVIRGVFLGIIVLVLFSASLTTGASPPPPPVNQSDKTIEETNQMNHSNNPDRHLEDCLVNDRYPQKILKWCGLITTYAEAHKLPPNLIAAVIWQESGGKPEAYSKSGAVGLMQVMPKDGIAASFMCVNGPCFSNRPSIAELVDPEFNVKYGTKMLARLNNRHGNLREALKAYGPMDVGYSYADKVLGIYSNYAE